VNSGILLNDLNVSEVNKLHNDTLYVGEHKIKPQLKFLWGAVSEFEPSTEEVLKQRQLNTEIIDFRSTELNVN
jgi:hypothetical protein